MREFWKAERSQSLRNVQLPLRRRGVKASGVYSSCRWRHSAEACSSQVRITTEPPTPSAIPTKVGVDSPTTKKSRGSRPPFGMPVKSIIHENRAYEQGAIRLQTLHLVYKSGVWCSKLAFRLQICGFQFTNKHLVLQTGTSDYNSANTNPGIWKYFHIWK